MVFFSTLSLKIILFPSTSNWQGRQQILNKNFNFVERNGEINFSNHLLQPQVTSTTTYSNLRYILQLPTPTLGNFSNHLLQPQVTSPTTYSNLR